MGAAEERRGITYRLPQGKAGEKLLHVLNAAIHLRRPILVTGRPGAGKTTLAYRVAYELMLGHVLVWPINTRSTLKDALYQYDAIGRLQNASLPKQTGDGANDLSDIGEYITLGPVGTALLPYKRPRVLLVDEVDKSDIDLPNDLLHVFEEGRFEIPELRRRLSSGERTKVRTHDGQTAMVGASIECTEFPVVLLTSNGERDFPPAFKRRCLLLDLPQPTEEELEAIVESHFAGHGEIWKRARDIVKRFSAQSDQLATDQLLNAVQLVLRGADMGEGTQLSDVVMQPLSPAGAR